ncbi:MAG: DUF4097 family beta strand repeat protein [Gemmatimonadaceae bacterium]|nr:DUF4097 family beta strand repeat protein [Gemmatimonadaceae bacterium]
MLAPSILCAQQKVDLRRAATADVSLRIQGAFGALRVIAWTKDSVVITGTLPKGFRIDGGMGGADGAPARGGKFFVEGPEPLGPSGGALEVHLPANATLWAKAFNAAIDVSGMTGSLDLNIVSGSVQVTGSPRELSVGSMDGTITVNGSPSWTRLKTADGNIGMHGGSSDAAFTTVSGMIRVSDGALERARFESVTGGVEFAGDLARGAALNVDTHSGAVDIRLAPKASTEIDAATITGAIEYQLGRQRPDVGRDGRGATLITMVGQGNARLTIRTFKGNIRLTSR